MQRQNYMKASRPFISRQDEVRNVGNYKKYSARVTNNNNYLLQHIADLLLCSTVIS